MKKPFVLILLLLLSQLSYCQWNARIDYDKRIKQDIYLNNLDRQLKAENAEKIAIITEMLSVKLTGLPYIDQKIEKLQSEKEAEVKDIVETYGDPFQSAEAMYKLKKIESSLKNNNWNKEGERVELNLKGLENDLQENLISKAQFDIEYDKYSKYISRTEKPDEIKELWLYVRPTNYKR